MSDALRYTFSWFCLFRSFCGFPDTVPNLHFGQEADKASDIVAGSMAQLCLLTILLLSIFALVTSTNCVPAYPIFTDNTMPLSLSSNNMTTVLEAVTTRSRNITYSPLKFLGVQCYHLQPATVNLEACQPLFSKLFEKGDVYEEIEIPNRSRFQYGYAPCTMMVSSPARDDRRINLSMAALVGYGIEILQTCQESSTGGAYTFQGTWQVMVTREAIRPPLGYGDRAED